MTCLHSCIISIVAVGVCDVVVCSGLRGPGATGDRLDLPTGLGVLACEYRSSGDTSRYLAVCLDRESAFDTGDLVLVVLTKAGIGLVRSEFFLSN